MWRRPKLSDSFVRDDVDEVFNGRKYVYHWIESRMTVRRYDLQTSAEEIVVARRKPMYGMDFAQLFYNKKMSMRWSEHRPRQFRPDDPTKPIVWHPVRQVNPMVLDKAQLTSVYVRMDPDWPDGRQFWDHASALNRVRNKLSNWGGTEWVLVDNIPPLTRVVTFFRGLHAIPLESLPAQSGVAGRERRFPDHAEIMVMVRSPKRAGSASALRWQCYGSFCTVGQYIDRVVSMNYSRSRAIQDISYDWSHGFIEIKIDGVRVALQEPVGSARSLSMASAEMRKNISLPPESPALG